MNKKYILILFLSILLPISGFYLFLNSNKSNDNNQKEVKNISITNDSIIEKNFYINELTGEKVYADTEPEFLKNRPLAVMVNNALPARPQVGLVEADLIYEMIAEGGITRYLAFYYSNLPEKVGPIRSTREYYLQVVKETGDAMLMHIGFSPQAREKIDTWNIRSLGLGNAPFYRDNFGNNAIATEHTAFAIGKNLHEKGLSLGWGGKTPISSWKFKDEKVKTSDLKKANYIEINFWYKGDYSGIFKYVPETNKYIRYSGFDEEDNPIPLVDRITKQNVFTNNVVILFADEFPIPNDDKNRLDYKLTGEGKGLVFRDGTVQEIVWRKDKLESRTKFYLVNNEEVEFNRGKTWVSVVPSRNFDQVIIN